MEGDLVPLLQARGHQRTGLRIPGCAAGEMASIMSSTSWPGTARRVVVVEVKTTLKRADDVKQFLEKLKKFTEYANRYTKGKQVYGAVAYLQGGCRTRTVICRAAGPVS